jgi:uncharacterized membrane protein
MNLAIWLVEWVHLLASVVWIGAIVILLFAITPGVREVLGTDPAMRRVMKSIGMRITRLVNWSIVALVATGVSLMVLGSEIQEGRLLALATKHTMVAIMIAVHLGRWKVVAPRLSIAESQDPASRLSEGLRKLNMNLVWSNLALGVVVMFLSVYA